jgi:hypothetical protein
MLSAAVSHGVLVVEGTPRSDTIVISRGTRGNYTVRVNDAVTSFSKKSFSKIRISAGRRDDLVTIGSDAMPIAIRASVSGGDGSDTIVGGAGDDSLDGGAGADQITGAAGNDTINGDNGADDLHGGDGGDSICGGRGDDQLHDDGGYDTVFGNAGKDLYYYGDKVRQFKDRATDEQSYAEPHFYVSSMATDALVLNHCPLYTKDGGQIQGGLVKAGGSTLVMSGNVLKGWKGAGLAASDAYVPHFDLPGGSFAGAGELDLSGSNTLIGGVNYAGGDGNDLIIGGATITFSTGEGELFRLDPTTNEPLPLAGTNTYNGSTTIDNGIQVITSSGVGSDPVAVP